MAHTKKQLEIMDWMMRFDLTESALARAVGIKINILSYQLNNAQDVKDKIYQDIKNYLISKKYLSEMGECEELFDLTTNFFASVGTQFNMFSN